MMKYWVQCFHLISEEKLIFCSRYLFISWSNMWFKIQLVDDLDVRQSSFMFFSSSWSVIHNQWGILDEWMNGWMKWLESIIRLQQNSLRVLIDWNDSSLITSATVALAHGIQEKSRLCALTAETRVVYLKPLGSVSTRTHAQYCTACRFEVELQNEEAGKQDERLDKEPLQQR